MRASTSLSASYLGGRGFLSSLYFFSLNSLSFSLASSMSLSRSFLAFLKSFSSSASFSAIAFFHSSSSYLYSVWLRR